MLVSLASLLLGGCPGRRADARCFLSSDCADGQVCAALDSSARVCVERCDVATTAVCTAGRACVALAAEDAQTGVCLPGGTVAIGSACVASVDCATGGLCVLAAGQTTPSCQRACDVGGTAVCAATETCTAIEPSASATRGTCVATAVP